MLHWLRICILCMIVLGSTWTTYTYLQIKSSPIRLVSEWALAVELNDAATVAQYTMWNGNGLTTDQAQRIIDALHKHPEWKQRIYQDLQKAAVILARKKQATQHYTWFKLVQDIHNLAYKVESPSLYFSISGTPDAMTLRINDQWLSASGSLHGPFMAIDTEIAVFYQNSPENMIENIALDVTEMWGEEHIHIVLTTPYVMYTVRSNVAGGDLFIDGHYAGELRGAERVGPLSYQDHVMHLEKTLPWGTVYSDPISAARDSTDVFIPVPLQTSTLFDQLGGCIVRFNESWANAMRTNDASQLDNVSPIVRKIMSDWMKEQEGQVYFNGHFVQVLLDPDSVTIIEKRLQHYEATVVVREDYTAAEWVLQDGKEHFTYAPSRYWQYALSYTPEIGWQVTDLVPLTVSDVGNPAWIAHHSERVLRIGVDAGLVPFEWIQDGELVGFDIDIMRWLEEKLGMTIVFRELPWNQLRTQFKINGELDGAISAIDTETANSIANTVYTIPYYSAEEQQYVIVLRSDLQHILEEMNDGIRQLHEIDSDVLEELKQKYKLKN